jgi:hypothetical protein
MATAQSYYLSHKATLSEKLENCASFKECCEIIETFILDLTDISGEYVRNLSPSQARLALTLLGTLRSVLRAIAASLPPSGYDSEPEIAVPTGGSRHVSPKLPLDALTGIGAAGVVGGSIAVPVLSIPLAIAVGLAASAATHSLVSSGNRHSSESDAPRPLPATLRSPTLPPALWTDFLEEALKATDDMVAEHGKLELEARPKKVTPRIEDHPGVLSFLQDLLGWYARRQSDLQDETFYPLRLHLEETLPDLLSRYSLSIRSYDPHTQETDTEIFDFEEEIGPQKLQSPQMIQPALLRNDQVVRKGRVILPKSR